MSRRWECRLLTVVAGAGFGKTMLLVAAIADSADHPSPRRDIWLSCEPADESGDHLGAGVATALGLSSDASLDAICESMWAAAPSEICLILDDVHEVPARSSGASFIAAFLTNMPGNAHLVLASRESVPVPTARLAVEGRLVRLGENELTFDGAELTAFAHARGIGAELLRPSGGWPALAS
jgi:LuxR family transcriptional regulator, maltose regulon positive regulatory protein